MACGQNPCNTTNGSCGNNGFVIIIVLYVLLAIILGSAFFGGC